jgi:hypothetical protein
VRRRNNKQIQDLSVGTTVADVFDRHCLLGGLYGQAKISDSTF